MYLYLYFLYYPSSVCNDTYTLNTHISNMKRSSNYPAVLMRALIMEIKLKHVES